MMSLSSDRQISRMGLREGAAEVADSRNCTSRRKLGISTPCIQRCHIGPSFSCTGCGRLLTDISGWQTYSEIKRKAIMRHLTIDKPDVIREPLGVAAPVKDAEPAALPLTIAVDRALREVQRSFWGDPHAATVLIAVLDAESILLAVNEEWKRFALANGAVSWEKLGVGANYLAVCHGARGSCSREASAFERGLTAVLAGERDSYELVSPCHSPQEKRWFAGRVLRCDSRDAELVSVLHLRCEAP